MKGRLLLLLVSLLLQTHVFAQKYIGKTGEASFFSSAPLEDIEATTTKVSSLLDTETSEIVVMIPVNTFEFEKSLMQEHFNEKYLETSEYRYAVFTGKINESINYNEAGKYMVTCTGVLKMHGVEKDYTVNGHISVSQESILYEAKFNIKLVDHDIKIPKIVFRNIAEIVEVTINGSMSPYKKK